MARKELFERDNPPEVVAIIDESVLHGHLIGPEAMADQLRHLTEVPAVVQVLPAETDIAPGLSGSFLLTSVGPREYVYVGTRARGFTLEEPELVSREASLRPPR